MPGKGLLKECLVLAVPAVVFLQHVLAADLEEVEAAVFDGLPDEGARDGDVAHDVRLVRNVFVELRHAGVLVAFFEPESEDVPGGNGLDDFLEEIDHSGGLVPGEVLDGDPLVTDVRRERGDGYRRGVLFGEGHLREHHVRVRDELHFSSFDCFAVGRHVPAEEPLRLCGQDAKVVFLPVPQDERPVVGQLADVPSVEEIGVVEGEFDFLRGEGFLRKVVADAVIDGPERVAEPA